MKIYIGGNRHKGAPSLLPIAMAKDGKAKKLVAPEVDKPKPGEHYAYIRDNKVYEHIWDDFMADRKLLNDGFVFRTRDDAQEMCDWLEACRKHVAFEDVTT